MTRSEAEQLARRLQAEHPDRDANRFVARPSPAGDWEVAKVAIPEVLRRGQLTPIIAATPRPSPADDPARGTSGGCREPPVACSRGLPGL